MAQSVGKAMKIPRSKTRTRRNLLRGMQNPVVRLAIFGDNLGSR